MSARVSISERSERTAAFYRIVSQDRVVYYNAPIRDNSCTRNTLSTVGSRGFSTLYIIASRRLLRR